MLRTHSYIYSVWFIIKFSQNFAFSTTYIYLYTRIPSSPAHEFYTRAPHSNPSFPHARSPTYTPSKISSPLRKQRESLHISEGI